MLELYGSFSSQPGNFGYSVHNLGYNHYNMNTLYYPFKVNNIKDAVLGMKALDIKGVGVSSPYKVDVIEYLDQVDELVEKTGSCNTVINRDGQLFGYNTDYKSVLSFIEPYAQSGKEIVVCGNGGYAKTVKVICEEFDLKIHHITRENWSDHEQYVDSNVMIFNATPVILSGKNTINANVETHSGKTLAYRQATEQFLLYTGKRLPSEVARELGIVP
jgi:shikimate 5-dehydrogenase